MNSIGCSGLSLFEVSVVLIVGDNYRSLYSTGVGDHDFVDDIVVDSMIGVEPVT